jgi:hypothetical protein
MSDGHDTPERVLAELLAHLRHDEDLTGDGVGRLPISRERGALYARGVAVLGYEPDTLDVVAFVMREARKDLRRHEP